MMSDGAHQLVARLSKPAEEHADEKTRSDSRRKPGAAAGVAPLDPPGGCQERGEHAQRRTASQPPSDRGESERHREQEERGVPEALDRNTDTEDCNGEKNSETDDSNLDRRRCA